MNEWSRYVQELMDANGWRQADLARASGVSPQVISLLLNDPRDRITRPPDAATVRGLARAFGGGAMEQRLWLRVAIAMGLPVGEEVLVADAELLSNAELVAEIGRRLRAHPSAGAGQENTVRTPDVRALPTIGEPASPEVATAAHKRRTGTPVRKPPSGRRPRGETGQT